jgi:hypothetical protein
MNTLFELLAISIVLQITSYILVKKTCFQLDLDVRRKIKKYMDGILIGIIIQVFVVLSRLAMYLFFNSVVRHG